LGAHRHTQRPAAEATGWEHKHKKRHEYEDGAACVVGGPSPVHSARPQRQTCRLGTELPHLSPPLRLPPHPPCGVLCGDGQLDTAHSSGARGLVDVWVGTRMGLRVWAVVRLRPLWGLGCHPHLLRRTGQDVEECVNCGRLIPRPPGLDRSKHCILTAVSGSARHGAADVMRAERTRVCMRDVKEEHTRLSAPSFGLPACKNSRGL